MQHIVIEIDEQLDWAIKEIDTLLDRDPRSIQRDGYLNRLSDVVIIYEDKHVILPSVSGVTKLRYLMEENSLTDQDLVPVLGDIATVRGILGEQVPLTDAHRRMLGEQFRLPASAFEGD